MTEATAELKKAERLCTFAGRTSDTLRKRDRSRESKVVMTAIGDSVLKHLKARVDERRTYLTEISKDYNSSQAPDTHPDIDNPVRSSPDDAILKASASISESELVTRDEANKILEVYTKVEESYRQWCDAREPPRHWGGEIEEVYGEVEKFLFEEYNRLRESDVAI